VTTAGAAGAAAGAAGTAGTGAEEGEICRAARPRNSWVLPSGYLT